MFKHPSVLILLVCSLLAAMPVSAQNGKAPCGSFRKLPDGKWSVVTAVKIEKAQGSVMLSRGTAISPGTRVLGVDVYAALEKSCH